MTISDGFKKLTLAAIGAGAITYEKTSEILGHLVEKGEITVDQGKIINSELKHNVKESVTNQKEIVKEAAQKVKEEAEEYNMAFYFTEGEHPVYISQKDIRQIQMAKSSICSGCLALLEEAGLTLESIDYLVLAGAFGNYIDIDNALSIGLLPPVSREKIISIGNGAGQGVQSFLLDQSYRVRAKNIANNCIHVSLAENKKFMESYIKNMNFSVEESL